MKLKNDSAVSASFLNLIYHGAGTVVPATKVLHARDEHFWIDYGHW